MENSELITKALSYIKNEYNQSEISIADVASHAGFSTDYFNRIFFMHTGFNVMEYVRFRRLKNAARLLRTSGADILNIALECGYETHESFSRAFKKQYGLSPAEYRKKYEAVEANYGEFYGETVGTRLAHEFKDFKTADPDEVIDHILEKDALRYGYSAVCFKINGGIPMYLGEDFKDGFIWFTEWNGHFDGEIICDDWQKIAYYLSVFSDDRFDMTVYTNKTNEEIHAELEKYGVNKKVLSHRDTNIYTGEAYALTAPEGFSARELCYYDYDMILKCYESMYHKSGEKNPRLIHLKGELYQRDVLGNDEHSVFIFGIFKDGKMIGISEGALQRAHGFAINNSVSTSVMKEFESEELYKYVFKFITNAALAKGALPVDELQTQNTEEARRSGKFNSYELGYKTAISSVILK